MTSEPLPQGSVIPYPYLWAAQDERGETQGRKTRPTCVVLRLQDTTQKFHHVMLLAITSKQPLLDQVALEIPDTERKRAGLTRYSRAWIIVSEYNYDIAEQSWYLEPDVKPLGAFGAPFLRQIVKALTQQMRASAKRVDRTK